MSLHRVVRLFVVTLSVLTLGTGASLMFLSTFLHRAARDMENSLHSVRLAEEMQVDLLTYQGARGGSAALQQDIRAKLVQARSYIDSPDEGQAVDDADHLVAAYFSAATAPGDPPAEVTFDRTLAALRRIVDTNVQQAEESVTRSAQGDMWGNRIAIGVTCALVVGTGVMLFWLQAAFRPVFEIRNVLKAFGAGDKGARIAARGPEELRGIGQQFNEMADALARQEHNQTAFLAAVAHDLRNPINALRLSAEALSLGAVSEDRLAGLMGVVKRQTTSLERMVGDLLDASRIAAGELELRLTECDARGIARDTYDLYSQASPTHQLLLDVPARPVHFRCDRLRIGQVLNNFISNAIKYSPGGGAVTLAVTERDGGPVFEVSDRGIGISPEDMPYVFEPFRRTQTARDSAPGVGLGLSVAQRIVRAHDGRIEVESVVGRGTTFRLVVPRPTRP